MKKKAQLAVLSILLAAVIAGGAWLLRPRGTDQPGPGPDASQVVWQQDENVRYQLAGRTDREKRPFWGYEEAYEKFFTYQGQLCQLASAGEDGSFAVELTAAC